MFSYMFSCVFIYYTFHIPFYFLYFLYFTCSYPFRVLHFVLSIYCIHILSYTIIIYLYSYTVHVLFSYTYIHVLFISYTVFLLYFSYDNHILCFSSYTVVLYFPIFSSCSYNYLYFHRIAVLCFSYHVLYTCHFLLGFMSAYTLEVDMGITVCTRRYYHCTRQ